MKNKKSKRDFFIKAILIIFFAAVFFSGIVLTIYKDFSFSNIMKKPKENILNNAKTSIVEIQTTKGNIQIALEPKKAPSTIANFLNFVDLKAYDGVIFNKNFDWIIQSDIPNSTLDNISLETNQKMLNITGIIGMAESEDNKTEGQNFYILKKDAPWLDGKTAVFGHVIFGMNIVNKIESGDKIITIIKVK